MLNASYSCTECVNREVAGLDSAFYTFQSPAILASAPTVVQQQATFRFPNIINLIPFKYVFIVVTLNNARGSGNTLAIQTDRYPGSTKAGQLISAMGRILIGPRSPDASTEVFDRLFETVLTSVAKISTVNIQFLNPDGTFYHFNGRDVSVALLFTIMEKNVTLG